MELFMTFYERLLLLIREKNTSIKQVEKACGLANASIRRWETQSPRFESVIKIASHLNTTLDYLANGYSEITTSNDVVLSANELVFTTLFNKLDNRDQCEMIDIIKLKYERSIKEKETQKNSDTEQTSMSPLSLQNNKAIKDTILNVNKTITENSLKEQKPTKSIAYIARNGSRGILELTEEEAEKLKNLKSDDLDF